MIFFFTEAKYNHNRLTNLTLACWHTRTRAKITASFLRSLLEQSSQFSSTKEGGFHSSDGSLPCPNVRGSKQESECAKKTKNRMPIRETQIQHLCLGRHILCTSLRLLCQLLSKIKCSTVMLRVTFAYSQKHISHTTYMRVCVLYIHPKEAPSAAPSLSLYEPR